MEVLKTLAVGAAVLAAICSVLGGLVWVDSMLPSRVWIAIWLIATFGLVSWIIGTVIRGRGPF